MSHNFERTCKRFKQNLTTYPVLTTIMVLSYHVVVTFTNLQPVY